MSTQRSRIVSLTALIVAIVVGIFLVSAAISLYIITVKVPTDLAHEIAAGVKQVFNFTPRTMIRENVVI
jgi:Tfp pilus assembly protein PilW